MPTRPWIHWTLRTGICGLAALSASAVRAEVAPTQPTQDTSTTLGARVTSTEAAHRFEALAPQLIQAAQIKPGNIVAIHGGPHMVPAIEAFAMEVQKAGGYPLMLLRSPRVVRSYFMDVPDQHLGRPALGWQEFQLKNVDLDIGLPTFENAQQAFADIPPERQTKVRQAGAESNAAYVARQNRAATRHLDLNGPPSRTDVEQSGLDSATYSRMYQAALDADYRAIAERGKAIQRALQAARQVRITSSEGTNITFVVGDRPVILDAGMVPPGAQGLLAARSGQLPGGSVRFAPVEASVNGKIRAARDQCDQPVKDEAIDVRNGMPENVRAATDEACVKEAVKAAGRFGWVQIGLNPALRVTNADANLANYLLDFGAGVVSVNFGPNQELGGANKAGAGWFIPLPRATVEVDGKVIVRDGELVS